MYVGYRRVNNSNNTGILLYTKHQSKTKEGDNYNLVLTTKPLNLCLNSLTFTQPLIISNNIVFGNTPMKYGIKVSSRFTKGDVSQIRTCLAI